MPFMDLVTVFVSLVTFFHGSYGLSNCISSSSYCKCVLSQTGMWEDIFKKLSYQFFCSCVIVNLAASRPGATWNWLNPLVAGMKPRHSPLADGGAALLQKNKSVNYVQPAIYKLFTTILNFFNYFGQVTGYVLTGADTYLKSVTVY